MAETDISESKIQTLLERKYLNTALYRISNIYVFRHDWETDFFVQQKSSRYCYEIEIKTTKSDYYADFKKKDKHEILRTGEVNGNPHKFRPNKFYYCVPSGLITIEEVPEYAGLMYVNGNNINVIKEAKFIHREKLNFDHKLCEKLYYYWRNSLTSIKIANHRCDNLVKYNNDLKRRLREKHPEQIVLDLYY